MVNKWSTIMRRSAAFSVEMREAKNQKSIDIKPFPRISEDMAKPGFRHS